MGVWKEEKGGAGHVALTRREGSAISRLIRTILFEIFLDCWMLIHLGYSQEFVTLIHRGAEYANICSQKLSKRKSEEKIFSGGPFQMAY